MPKKLTKEQVEERMKLYRAGLPDKKIAEKLGVSSDAICSWRLRKGLTPNPSDPTLRKKPESEKTPGELLTERNAEARAHGMSYGKYWAMKREES